MSGSTNEIVGVVGRVKWFDPRKGFGFIVGPDEQDIFVHYTVINSDGFRALKDGSLVEYDAALGDKGWSATRVAKQGDDDAGNGDSNSESSSAPAPVAM